MPVVAFKKKFKFSPNGYDVISYKPGQTAEVSEECARIAEKCGVLEQEKPTEPKKPTNKKK